MSPEERSPARRAAEEVYVQALSLGGDVDVDALAGAHPELGEELRSLQADWERVVGVHAALVAQRDATAIRREEAELIVHRAVDACRRLDRRDQSSLRIPDGGAPVRRRAAMDREESPTVARDARRGRIR